MTAHVIAYDTANPGDVSDFSRNLARFEPARIRKLALLVKTEGNSDVNDFSREFALLSLTAAIEAHGGKALAERSTFLISTGCEGAMTPFGYLFVDLEDAVVDGDRGGRSHGVVRDSQGKDAGKTPRSRTHRVVVAVPPWG